MSATQAAGGADLAGRAQELRAVCIEELSRILSLNPAEFDGMRSFDDYGLDSIDALVALGAISERLGMDLPPELLFIHRTLDAAVEAVAGVRASGERDGPGAVEVRSFWFPGGGILDEPLVINFRARLNEIPPFETIHVGGWYKWMERGWTIDDLAAAALAQIQASAPSGPLLLAGDSQGGQLAYATALAAMAAGREVAGLVLFDTAPAYPILTTTLPVAGARLFTEGLALLRARDRRSLGDYQAFLAWHAFQLLLAVMSPEQLLTLARRLRSSLFRHPRIDRRLQTIAFGILWAAWPWAKRTPLDRPAVLLRSDEPGHEDFGWGATLPQLAVIRVSGGHRSMFNADHAPVLHQMVLRSLAGLMGWSELAPP